MGSLQISKNHPRPTVGHTFCPSVIGLQILVKAPQVNVNCIETLRFGVGGTWDPWIKFQGYRIWFEGEDKDSTPRTAWESGGGFFPRISVPCVLRFPQKREKTQTFDVGCWVVCVIITKSKACRIATYYKALSVPNLYAFPNPFFFPCPPKHS